MAGAQESQAVRWLSAAASSLALSAACQGGDWIIGGELPSDMDAAGEDPDGPSFTSDPGACPSSLDLQEQRRQQYAAASVAAAHVGRWRGALSDVAASSFPSRELNLDIDANGAGTLRFDAPMSDQFLYGSDDGYLCSAEAAGVVCGSTSGFVGGFAYPLGGAGSRDGVLSFMIVTADPWGSWCAEHEPVSWEEPRQACGVAFGVLPDGMSRYSVLGCSRLTPDGAEAIDCALMYALDYCQCGRDACFARFDRSVEVGLTLSEDGMTLTGSLWYENERDAAFITLTRVP
jgi:hypothetical protein